MKFFSNNTLFFAFLFIILLFYPQTINAYYKYQFNPVVQIYPSSWKTISVWAPSVINHDNNFYMYYGGFNSIYSQIGFSSSFNAINWEENLSNPVIKWDAVTSAYYGVSHPSITINKHNLNPYQIWFNQSESGERYSLYYLDSNNGSDWNNPQKLIFDNLQTTWDTDSRAAPTVIYDETNKKYHMWFYARGWYENIWNWRFGYASSDDGINWVKYPIPLKIMLEDGTTPVSDAGGNPGVIKLLNKYILFYETTNNIEQAESSDGINWKRIQQNPVIQKGTNTQDFDYKDVSDPNPILINDVIYIFYSGKDIGDKTQIGLATSVPITPPAYSPTPTSPVSITPSPTAISTPTNTPSPTNILPTATITPHPSAQPSPTPAGIQDIIIFVPGLGGSWGPKSLCDINASSGWKLAPYAFSYNRLLDTLQKQAGLKLDKDFYVYAYDWRKNLDYQADAFKEYFQNVIRNISGGQKVKLVGHSMGGLVIRSFLTKYPSDKVSSVLTIGTPHAGSLSAYPVWEGGETDGDDLVLKIGLNHLISRCKIKYELEGKTVKSRAETVRIIAPSIKDILPVFDYIYRYGQLYPALSMKQQNGWIKNHQFPSDLFGVNFHTLSGNNISTVNYFNVIDRNEKDARLNLWEDGKPVSNEISLDGDGTVLNRSSMVNGADNLIIPGSHQQIMYSDEAMRKILDFLNLNISPLYAVKDYKKALSVFIDSPVEFTVTDPKGNSYESRDWILSVFDPETGRYKISIKSQNSGNAYMRIGEDSIDQTSSDNEFTLNLNKNKTATYFFDYSPGRISSLSSK